jgi:hypothetical protein
MEPTKLQKKICELVKSQASFWINTNDIDSPTHYCDMLEELNDIDELTEGDKDELFKILIDLYTHIRYCIK